jgi:hypothetical protein
MPLADFDKFCQIVFSDAALLAELRRAPDLPALIAHVVSTARERGLELSEQDLQAVANRNWRAWLERWLYQ